MRRCTGKLEGSTGVGVCTAVPDALLRDLQRVGGLAGRVFVLCCASCFPLPMFRPWRWCRHFWHRKGDVFHLLLNIALVLDDRCGARPPPCSTHARTAGLLPAGMPLREIERDCFERACCVFRLVHTVLRLHGCICQGRCRCWL